MTAARQLIGYLSAFLGCISLGLIGAPFAIQATRLCEHPSSITGQICRGKVPEEVPEATWANAGAVAYQTAAKLMAKQNAAPVELDEIQKYFLRPHFGDMVDRVQVVYNSQLVDDWIAASFRINVGHSNAQVYGNRIYIKEPYKAADIDQLVLLAHELVHVQQYEQLGGLEQFGAEYFQAYKRADQTYKKNVFEQEAFAFEAEFRTWLMEEMRQYGEY